jgi:hypothetical protein
MLVLFHVATWLLFNIGMFPWIMIVSATILFPADWPRHWLGKAGRIFPRFLAANRPLIESGSRTFVPRPGAALLAFLAVYVLVQIGLPLRPYFSAEPAAWTCSGFNCGWEVMIAEKTGFSQFSAVDPRTGRQWKVFPDRILSARQKTMMDQDPFLIRDMARWAATNLPFDNSSSIQIRVQSFAALNGRPSQLLIDPNVDLSGKKALPSTWIQPLKQ